MPGIEAASGHPGGEAANSGGVTRAALRYSALRRQEAASPKHLYAVDARRTPGSPVADVQRLTSLAAEAVRAGGGHVLDSSHVLFPNGAVTLVLILAESHLSIHTWPEEDLVALDLFSCGAIDGRLVVDRLCRSLALTDVRIRQLPRGPASA